MKKYSGIDLHSNNNLTSVSDENDRVLFAKRLPNELSRVLEALEAHRDEMVGVVVESTYNWYWLVDGLQAAGYKVHLANAAAIKQYSGLKRSDDKSDAAHLAHLLRLGILPTGYIYPREQRGLRDLARRRMQLVRQRSMHVLAVENVQARETGSRMTGDKIKRLSVQAVNELGYDAEVARNIAANVAVIGALNQQIAQLEKYLLEQVGLTAQYNVLTSAPGVGKVLATVIMLETGSIERFAAVGNYASYACCVDSVRTSNDKKKGRGNKRNGNQYLAWAFIEAANMARRWSAEAKRFHERKSSQTNAIVATKALAHKLARACYHMLRTGERFQMQRCFG
ncbi:MAG TPA: IS110 family transposase [Candidatus Acidoferrales bacterium]|nr:IS110 family transposase [Candidatus Acidoferrales bacterium]